MSRIQDVIGLIVSFPPIRETLRLFFKVIAPPVWFAVRLPIVGNFKVRIGDTVIQYRGTRYDSLGRLLCWKGIKSYEPEVYALLSQRLEGCTVMLDIGANVGIISLISGTINDGLKIYAFEPVPSTYKTLEYHIKINGLSDRIFPYQQVVSESNGEQLFHIPDHNIASASLDSEGFHGLQGKVSKIPSTTVDEFVRAQKIPSVDILKIDVEGFEASVLRGATETLKRDLPIMICECLPDGDAEAVENLLRPHDYAFFHMTAEGLINKEHITPDATLKYQNYFFIPKSKLGVGETTAY